VRHTHLQTSGTTAANNFGQCERLCGHNRQQLFLSD
jgi:hypothetical protein